jgi:PAS domain S-box-containing protein
MAGPTRRAFDEALMREALFGAGTSVWEWHLPSDELTNVDTTTALLGYGPGEIVSNQAAWDEVIHPDDRAGIEAAVERHARGASPIFEHEYRARHKDGRWVWLSERGRIVEWGADGQPLRMLGTITDISQRRQAQDHVLALAERLQQIARAVPGMVFQFERKPDGASRFPWVSESCRDLVGLPPENLMADATDFLRLVPDAQREQLLAGIGASAQSLAPWRADFPVRHAKGERRLTGSASPRRLADGTTLWHGYLEDTTDLRQLEAARRTAAEAAAASAAKTLFLSRVSHELRTPLNAVLGFAQLLALDAEPPLSAIQARRVGLIREAGGHLLEMIGELLDLTRAESGKLVLHTEDLAVLPLLDETCALLAPQAAQAGVTLGRPPLPPELRVRADRTRLRQVLLNLVSNALKYNRPGGTVQLACAAVAGGVEFVVADSGVGIAPGDLPRLFEPFERLAQAGSGIEGAGIGLAITHRLVELMGGTIAVDSTVGRGSTFRVVLPAAQIDSLPT